jgi:hypothetical protein
MPFLVSVFCLFFLHGQTILVISFVTLIKFQFILKISYKAKVHPSLDLFGENCTVKIRESKIKSH